MHAPLPPDSMTLAYHELRAPLGLMATAAASVAEASPDATARAQCEVIMRAAERLLRTTARVLALAQPAPAGTEACAYTPAPLVERIVADFGDLDVQLDFATSVVAARALVWGHEADFETLVSSLLMNAIDHGDPNEPISIFVEDDGTTVSVCIRNQAATARRHRGFALGTQLCEELARRMSATLRSSLDERQFSAQIEMPHAV